MSTNKSIFVDLEIESDLMMTDPELFASQVISMGDELTSIFTGKTSVKGATDDATKQARTNHVAKEMARVNVSDIHETINSKAEEMDLDELYHTIAEMKSVVESLELTFHSRARNDMIMNTPNIEDKKLAHSQYKKLREAFGAFIVFSELMHDKTYVNLKPRTGNYQGDASTFPAYRYEGEVYQNYRAVAKLVGWNPDDYRSHMDLVEKIRAEDMEEIVEIIEVTL